MPSGFVFNIMRYCVHDGPGIRTTVFFKGCPLRCWWCHNPEGLSPRPELMYREDRCLHCGDCVHVCPNGAVSQDDGTIRIIRDRCRACGTCAAQCYADAREVIGKEMTVDAVMDEVEKDVPFFEQSGGGVTFSGGEPLMQPEFLRVLLQECKRRGIHTTVDTSGYAPQNALKEISEWTDLFLYDLKAINDRLHREHTGVSNELILANLRSLSSSGKNVIVRVPLIAGVNDTPEAITDLERFISMLGGVREVHILPYHGTGAEKYGKLGLERKRPGAVPPSQEQIDGVAAALGRAGFAVAVGG